MSRPGYHGNCDTMRRIERHKEACAHERRTRWRRDGLLSLCVGLFLGMLVWFVQGWDPWITIPAFGVVSGALGAILGPRIWQAAAAPLQ